MHGKEEIQCGEESRKSPLFDLVVMASTSNRRVVIHPIAISSATSLDYLAETGLRRSVLTSKDRGLTRECYRQAWSIYDIAWTVFDVSVAGPATDPRSPEAALRRRQNTGPSEPELAPLGGFESAAPQLVGRAVGTHNQPAFLRALRLTAGGDSPLRDSQAPSPWAFGEQLVGVVTSAGDVSAEVVVKARTLL